jgi:hypothetical protein
MGIADFCQDPIPFALQVLDPTTTSFETISYYSTCNGTSPFATYLDSAQQAVTYFNENIDDLVAACPDSTYVAAMKSELPLLNSEFDDILNITACPPFQEQVQSVLQDAVCDSGFTGMFIIWSSQYVTAFLLFALTVLASVAYQYFGQYWNITDQQNKDAIVLESPVYNYNYFDGPNTMNKV